MTVQLQFQIHARNEKGKRYFPYRNEVETREYDLNTRTGRFMFGCVMGRIEVIEGNRETHDGKILTIVRESVSTPGLEQPFMMGGNLYQTMQNRITVLDQSAGEEVVWFDNRGNDYVSTPPNPVGRAFASFGARVAIDDKPII